MVAVDTVGPLLAFSWVFLSSLVFLWRTVRNPRAKVDAQWRRIVERRQAPRFAWVGAQTGVGGMAMMVAWQLGVFPTTLWLAMGAVSLVLAALMVLVGAVIGVVERRQPALEKEASPEWISKELRGHRRAAVSRSVILALWIVGWLAWLSS